MKVHYVIGSEKVLSGSGSGGFLLGNSIGDFFPEGLNSKYSGWSVYLGEMFNVLHSFRVDGEISQVSNHLGCVWRKRSWGKEHFFVPKDLHGLVYETSKDLRVDLLFDCKKVYDQREFGREYETSVEDGVGFVWFRKRGDERDGDVGEGVEYELFVAVAAGELEVRNEWTEQRYDFDQQRGSKPFSRFVFHGFSCNGSRVILGVGRTKHEARENLKEIESHLGDLKKDRKREVAKLARWSKRFGDRAVLGLIAKNSLQMLFRHKELIAGLPWFFQQWHRDCAISLGAADKAQAHAVIERSLRYIDEQGTMPTATGFETRSADALGWYFVRAWECFPKDERGRLGSILVRSLERLHSSRLRNGLVWNGPLETWMDTRERGDTREGFRIEIQALLLAMYHLAFKITGKVKWLSRERSLRQHVRSEFLVNGVLSDGRGDPTIRPNVFLAAYVYPDLLSREEWEKCFDKIIPSLWLEWGGLSSIDTKNGLFCPEHSGEHPKSYHRGDSWFWVNNIAAIVLHRVNPKRYSPYIKAIVQASSDEMLWKGVAGHCAEVSSAGRFRSEGSPVQTWSCATFLELLEELR